MERDETLDARMDQFELPERPIEKRIHRGVAFRCPECGKIHKGKIPKPIKKQGLLGKRLKALVGELNLTCHASVRSIQETLAALGCDVSLGLVNNALSALAKALERPYQELGERLQNESVLNIDETGHKEKGARMYVLGFNGPDYTYFKIDFRTRSVLETVLGPDFKGVIGCDCFSGYKSYFMRNKESEPAYCYAHLIRELKYLSEHENETIKKFGGGMLDVIKKMFEHWHAYRANPTDGLRAPVLRQAEMLREYVANAPKDVRKIRKIRNITRRFEQFPDGYFVFLFKGEVEPTNNVSESSFRFVAIVRNISFGTGSLAGRRARERLWTAFATCRRQHRPLFPYLVSAYTAHCRGEFVPTLLRH
jgi:hypothetical protein